MIPRLAAAGLAVLAASALVAGCARKAGARGEGEAASGATPAPDLFLITIDTLRADALGFAGNRRVATPNLDRIASEGLVFERAHASNVVTLPSHANILTGLYPYQHGVRENSGFRLDPKVLTLATALAANGYATGAFVGAFPLDSRFGLDRGFETYDDRYPPGGSPDDFEMRERPGVEVVAAALKWYRGAAGRPRFVWMHLYEPHAPYRPPSPFAETYARNPYLGEVAAADTALKPVFEAAREAGPGRAVVVVTADHGEALGDHGEATHGLFAYEATLKVPLVVWAPGRVPPGKTPQPARHVDILPTLLELAGTPIPSGLPGRSLLPSPPGRGAGGEGVASADTVIYFESLSASLNRGWAPLTGVLQGSLKFIDLPLPELYDLSADPGEKSNLYAQRQEDARRLKRLLPEEASKVGARTAADSEEARRLLSLGYLSGGAGRKAVYGPEDDPKRLVHLDAKIHRVVAHFGRGETAKASALATEIVRERPSMSAGYELLAFLLHSQGRAGEAARVLTEAIRRDLASEAMRVRLALIFSESGRPADALRVLAPLSASADPDTRNAFGIALADAGRGDEAVAVFDGILRSDPDNALAHQNKGIALLKRGETVAAIASLDRGLAISSDLPRAWNAKGVAQAQSGDPAGAIASWRRAAQLDPRQYDALFNIGLVAARQGNSGVARDALRRFVETAPAALYDRDIQQARRILREIGGA
jgi:arylsulfatase A-like enzyme/Flp pilus assembly protein TadD